MLCSGNQTLNISPCQETPHKPSTHHPRSPMCSHRNTGLLKVETVDRFPSSPTAGSLSCYQRSSHPELTWKENILFSPLLLPPCEMTLSIPHPGKSTECVGKNCIHPHMLEYNPNHLILHS